LENHNNSKLHKKNYKTLLEEVGDKEEVEKILA
jgi:hypothetical protein